MATAKFEQPRKLSMREWPVSIDVYISETVTVQAETIEEANLKAKQALRDLVEKGGLIKVRE